jgi:hypothetical protein
MAVALQPRTSNNLSMAMSRPSFERSFLEGELRCLWAAEQNLLKKHLAAQ